MKNLSDEIEKRKQDADQVAAELAIEKKKGIELMKEKLKIGIKKQIEEIDFSQIIKE